MADDNGYQAEPLDPSKAYIVSGRLPVPEHKRYRGPVSVGNPAVHPESVHRGTHWRAEDCVALGCRPRDEEAPAPEALITENTVVIEQTLEAPDA